jgi:hypothetical protein
LLKSSYEREREGPALVDDYIYKHNRIPNVLGVTPMYTIKEGLSNEGNDKSKNPHKDMGTSFGKIRKLKGIGQKTSD